MQSRAARAITRAVVVAGTAGAIATACWRLNRIIDDSIGRKRIGGASTYVQATNSAIDECDGRYSDQEQQFDEDDDFALLPVVSESDDESDECALGYTAAYFTPHHDVCMLSVSVQKQVDPLPHVPPSNCRLCRAASAQSFDAARDGVDLGEKLRTLSFSETDSSSNGSLLSMKSEWSEEHEEEDEQRPQQWLYVRL